MTDALCLRIHPLTLGPRADTDALAARWGARFWALHADPVRLISQVHPISFDAMIASERTIAQGYRGHWETGEPAGWHYPWHLDTAYLLDRLQAEAPPLQVAHYCLVWPATTTARETLPATLAQTFLLPGAAVARLPNLIPGAYREQARYLEPLQPGYPYLAILVAYASLGSWDLASWWDLLLADVPLTVALDVQTLRRDTARTRVLNAANRLWTALHGTQQVIDPDSDDAYQSAKEAHRALREQNLHLVTTAILISGREPAELDRADQIVQERLAANLRLERPTGGQRELAKLFTPLPFERVHYPVVSWNT
jgi:hypothetical protein